MLALGTGGYALLHKARPYLHGSGCEVNTSTGKMPLDLEQGANASTIAAVAIGKRLPERAAVIAYATAIQESHIRNLPHGDRDSVGMFQQRPSQGWGSEDKLRDPVQATAKFYGALVKVKDYLDRDLHDAAQRVQRSADGRAYAQHEPDGKLLAAAFTGREPGTARCWFPPGKRTEPRRPEALREMRRAFGGKLKISGPGDLAAGAKPGSPNGPRPLSGGGQEPDNGPSSGTRPLSGGGQGPEVAPSNAGRGVEDGSASWNAVAASSPRNGWAIATWAVTHARVYGLTEVRFAGRHWRADAGHDGWTTDKRAGSGSVIIH